MSFENLSEVLWSTPGGKGLFGLFDRHPTDYNNINFNGTDGLSLFYNDPITGVGDGSGSNGTTPNNFLVGISIAVGTSFIQSLGLTIQRKSHVINEAIHPKELRRQACHRPLWHLGFHTYILSNLTGTIFSIGYLPVIILAPLGAVTLVFNALFARLLLGDTFSRQSAAGTADNIILLSPFFCCRCLTTFTTLFLVLPSPFSSHFRFRSMPFCPPLYLSWMQSSVGSKNIATVQLQYICVCTWAWQTQGTAVMHTGWRLTRWINCVNIRRDKQSTDISLFNTVMLTGSLLGEAVPAAHPRLETLSFRHIIFS